MKTRSINGYVVVERPHDPGVFKSGANAGFKYAHRAIVEHVIGRKLADDEVVHHINGNKSDNSPDNLLVLTKSEHSVLHHCLKTDPSIAQLPTYKQTAIARMSKKKQIGTCSKCGGECSANSSICRRCSMESNFKPITAEFRENIQREVNRSSYSSVARRLGVSDHTVRKIVLGKSSFIQKDRTLLDDDPVVTKPKTVSPETRAALSDALHQYWADRPSPDDIAVVQLDGNGNVIEEFRSARDAQRKTGIANAAINQCCHGKRRSYKGFVWKFKRDM